MFDARLTLLQPPHFVAEVSAVLARESPATAAESLRDLLEIEMQVIDSEPVHARAMALAARHGQHLFDTLYHAVALEAGDAVLVTADARYARKARAEGGMVELAAFDFGRV